MEQGQKINCTGRTIKSKLGRQECTLQNIIVEPVQNCHIEGPYESMCASYKFNKEKEEK